MTNDFSSFFAPRWTRSTVFLAGAISLGMYLLLPYLEKLSAPPEKNMFIHNITTAILPPPPPHTRREVADPKRKRPKPELRQLRRRLTPMQAAMNLSSAIGDVGGDFGIGFAVSDDALSDQVKKLVFEIGELDDPPRPMARLQPLYPPQARMHRIEGVVVMEFVVTAEGETSDIVVVSSQPGEIFVAPALRAIERWRFAPGTKDGRTVATRVRQKIEFKLD